MNTYSAVDLTTTQLRNLKLTTERVFLTDREELELKYVPEDATADNDVDVFRSLNDRCYKVVKRTTAAMSDLYLTLDELRAYTGNATRVQVSYNGTIGVFELDQADTTSADNTGTIVLDGKTPTAGRWKRKFDGPVYPEWFGTDGVDDTAAFLQMIDTLTDNQSVIIERTFHVTDSLLFDGFQNLQINFIGGKIHQEGSNKKTLYFKDCTRIVIKNPVLVGSNLEDINTSTSFNGVAGVYLQDCQGVIIDNPLITNHAGGGIRWTGTLDGLWVFTGKIVGVGVSKIAAGDNTSDFGIGSISATSSKNIWINGVEISESALGVGVGGYAENVNLNDVMINDIRGQHGFYFSDCVANLHNVTIDNCAYLGGKFQLDGSANVSGVINCNNVVIRNTGQYGFLIGVVSGQEAYSFEKAIIDNLYCYNTQGVNIRELTELQAGTIEVKESTLYGFITTRLGRSNVKHLTVNGTERSGLYETYGTGDHTYEVVSLYNTARNVAVGSSGPQIYAVGSASWVNGSYATKFNLLEIGYTEAEPVTLSNAIRSASPNPYNIGELRNFTTKGFRFDGGLLRLDRLITSGGTFVLNADRDPSSPIRGHGRQVFYSTQDPATAGSTNYFLRGDIVYNATPSAGGTFGWICVTAGTPGTWKTFGAISA